MALLTITDNKLTLANFQTASQDDTLEFRGATLTVASAAWDEVEGEGIVMEVQLTDANGRIRGRLRKTITEDDAGYAAALAELEGA